MFLSFMFRSKSESVSVSTAKVMMFTVPFFGIFFSTVFLGESFDFVQVIGSVAMLIGAAIATGIIESKKSEAH